MPKKAQWRSMATAPADRRPFLAFVPRSGEMENFICIVIGEKTPGGAVDWVWEAREDWVNVSPALWMPLPDPPVPGP